jgi:hypothetical protein
MTSGEIRFTVLVFKKTKSPIRRRGNLRASNEEIIRSFFLLSIF